MSSRDTYSEPSYGYPPKRPQFEKTVADAPQPQVAKTVEPIPVVEAQDMSTGFEDYFAGLALIMCVLAIGLMAGYFGRGFFSSPSQPKTVISVLGTKPVPAVDTISASVDQDVVFLGSVASEQMVSLEILNDERALMLIKTYTGADQNSIQTRFLEYSASQKGEQGHALTKSKTIKGTGLDMVRIGDNALISAVVRNKTLVLSRIDDKGKNVWSKSYDTGAVDRTEISLARKADGIVVIAPADNRNLSRVLSITSDGTVQWDKLFDRARTWRSSLVSADELGNTFVVLGDHIDAQKPGDQNIVLIDDQGRVVRQLLLNLAGEETISGLVPRETGGVTFLIAGDAPRLEHITASGQRLASTSLPHLQFLNDAHLLPAQNGDLIVATTYSLIGNQVDLSLERRNPDGALLGQRTISLPVAATLDDIVEVKAGEFLIGGSIRRNRYMPTDLFVQRVGFTPSSGLALAELPTPQQADLASSSAAESPAAAIESVELAETPISDESIPASVPETQSTPMIASLAITQMPVSAEIVSENAIDTQIADTVVESQPLVEPAEETLDAQTEAMLSETAIVAEAGRDSSLEETEASSIEGAVETSATESEDAAFDIFTTLDPNGVAASRFLDAPVFARCRFTCLDETSGSTFPMTGDFLPAVLASAADVAAAHARMCQSAKLVPSWETKPQCTAG